VVYSERHSVFLVLGSASATITFFHLTAHGNIVRGETVVVRDLIGKYSRSFSLVGDYIYFVSEPGVVTRARYDTRSIEVIDTVPLPAVARSPNDLFRSSDGRWYLSATPRTLLSAASLEELGRGHFVDLSERMPIRGTPYYLSEQRQGLVIPFVTEASGAILLSHGEIATLFDFGY
jgi:hypothetical protein